MTGRQPAARVFFTVPREVACEKWAGWWTHHIKEKHGGNATHAAEAIFGLMENGNVRNKSQCQKWQFAENNSLPGEDFFATIVEYAGIQEEDVLNHDYVGKTKTGRSNARNRHTGPRSMATKQHDAVFHIDNPDIPAPDMSFKSSDEFKDHDDFELKATLPMAGVLALMAMLDDATS